MDYFDDPNLCLVCFGYHPLKYCKYFKTFTTIQRLYLVNVHRYCPKCFSKAHLLDECTLIDSCSKCAGQHHTMLHQMEEECTEHEPCRPLRQCRAVDCANCEAARYERLHGHGDDTSYRNFESFRSKETIFSPSPYTTLTQRMPAQQKPGTSKRKTTLDYRHNEPEKPSSSSLKTRHDCPETSRTCCHSSSAPLFSTRTPTSHSSRFSFKDPIITKTSHWPENVPHSSSNTPIPQCCRKQRCPYDSQSSTNVESQESSRNKFAWTFPNTQPIRFCSTSPKSESVSELSFRSLSKKRSLSPSSESPLKRNRLRKSSFSTRRSRSPSIESEFCGDDRDDILIPRTALKHKTEKVETNRNNKNVSSDDKSQSEINPKNYKVPLHSLRPPKILSRETLSTGENKFDKETSSVTRRRLKKQTPTGDSRSHLKIPLNPSCGNKSIPIRKPKCDKTSRKSPPATRRSCSEKTSFKDSRSHLEEMPKPSCSDQSSSTPYPQGAKLFRKSPRCLKKQTLVADARSHHEGLPKPSCGDQSIHTSDSPDDKTSRNSPPATRRSSRDKIPVKESKSQLKETPTPTCSNQSIPTPNPHNTKISRIHHQQLQQIQLYLQQLLRHLKSPKEYWHTPANRRRQTLLRQELSQLKSQLKKLIQDIQYTPNLQTQRTNTYEQQHELKTLFQHLLSLLQKCHALSSSRQLNTCIQQLKEHLQHQVDATPNAIGTVLKFRHFMKVLQNLESSCHETDAGCRINLLQQRLGLRIILRHLLKAALEQLTDMLR